MNALTLRRGIAASRTGGPAPRIVKEQGRKRAKIALTMTLKSAQGKSRALKVAIR